MVEQPIRNRQVIGSSPIVGSTVFNRFRDSTGKSGEHLGIITVEKHRIDKDQETDANELLEVLELRRSECTGILENLLKAPPSEFDQSLRLTLPLEGGGLYVITRMHEPKGRYLYAGESGRLRGRIWADHQSAGGPEATSDFVQKVIDRGEAANKHEAKSWIVANCLVQWTTVEDAPLRCWAEHYMLSILQPIWNLPRPRSLHSL